MELYFHWCLGFSQTCLFHVFCKIETYAILVASFPYFNARPGYLDMKWGYQRFDCFASPSFFVLKQRTKQENSNQNDPCHALLQGRNFRPSWQASLPKFRALQHSQPRLLHVLAGPPHSALNLWGHNTCGANKQYFN
jgi:hypothetical protein